MKSSVFATFIILALAGYFGYGYATEHFNQPALIYKDFADAVIANDLDQARNFASAGAAQSAFQNSARRHLLLGQGDIKLTYYTINSFYYSDSGDAATIDAVQTVRVDPPGANSVFGQSSVSFPEHAELEFRDGLWKVKSFSDSLSTTTR
jgi:hypothetical protein